MNKGSLKAQRIASPPCQRLYDLKSAAKYLGRSVWSVREMIWRGELPVVRSGRKQYLDLFDMDAWVERNKVVTL
jgi:excisionase family DNA binding protein